jgi:predicted nucleic acid-binding protein
LQEFYVAVTHKLAVPLKERDAEKAVIDLSVLPVVQVDVSMIMSAIKISQSLKFSFWDSLIIESAISAGARILYSEDLQHGQTIDELQIINPYI